MKWLTFIALLVFLSCHANFGYAEPVVSPSPHSGSVPESYKAGEILVKFKEGTLESVRRKIHEKMGSTVVREFRSIAVQQIKIRDDLTAVGAVRLYQAESVVKYAELISIVQLDNDNR